MTDSALSKEQALDLLQKLSTDDNFRASYEKSPAAALGAAGISSKLLEALPAASLASGKLLPKEAFAKSLAQVKNDAADVFLCLRPPSVQLRSNEASQKPESANSTPFLGS